jgi:predicted amidohydrolase
MLPDGRVSTYTKQHLHPGEELVFAPGSGGPTLRAGGRTVALAICAEINHPEHAARAAALEASVYAAGVLITPDGYAADTALLERYAREHRMAVLMANHAGATGGWVSAGRSAIWSPGGTLIVASPGTEETLVIGRERNGAWTGVELPVGAKKE